MLYGSRYIFLDDYITDSGYCPAPHLKIKKMHSWAMFTEKNIVDTAQEMLRLFHLFSPCNIASQNHIRSTSLDGPHSLSACQALSSSIFLQFCILYGLLALYEQWICWEKSPEGDLTTTNLLTCNTYPLLPRNQS